MRKLLNGLKISRFAKQSVVQSTVSFTVKRSVLVGYTSFQSLPTMFTSGWTGGPARQCNNSKWNNELMTGAYEGGRLTGKTWRVCTYMAHFNNYPFPCRRLSTARVQFPVKNRPEDKWSWTETRFEHFDPKKNAWAVWFPRIRHMTYSRHMSTFTKTLFGI